MFSKNQILQLLLVTLGRPALCLSQSYTFQRVLLPLAGAPRFLRLHTAAIFTPQSQIETKSPQVVVLDFVPLDATSFRTLSGLLAGKKAPGELRMKQRHFPACAFKIGRPCTVAELDIDVMFADLERSFDTDLKLVDNNCWSFVDVVDNYVKD